jgi:uroporphyrinogen decarboxylase
MTWGLPEGSILTEQDLDRIVPPDPRVARAKLEKYLDAVKGTNVGVCARLSGIMTLTYMALGPIPIESFMYLLYDNPVLVKRLMGIFLEYHTRLIETIKDLPYHLYYIGDDIGSTAGPLISPDSMVEFWVPGTKKLIDTAQATMRPIIFHCCGVQAPILPYMIEWGVNAVHPLQPVANDIYAVKAKYGTKLTLVGNIDVAGLLSYGTPAEVRESVREHIERLADGSYVVCSSHSIIDSVPPENYIAMVKAAQEFGSYK